jgi:transposase
MTSPSSRVVSHGPSDISLMIPIGRYRLRPREWFQCRDSSRKPTARIMRYELADHEWTAIKPMMPNKPRGVPRVNGRRHGIFWVLRSGARWRDLPDAFGAYTTCYNRFVRWRRAGADTFFVSQRAQLSALTACHQIPAAYSVRELVAGGVRRPSTMR